MATAEQLAQYRALKKPKFCLCGRTKREDGKPCQNCRQVLRRIGKLRESIKECHVRIILYNLELASLQRGESIRRRKIGRTRLVKIFDVTHNDVTKAPQVVAEWLGAARAWQPVRTNRRALGQGMGFVSLLLCMLANTVGASLWLTNPWPEREITIGYGVPVGQTYNVPPIDLSAAVARVNAMSAMHLTVVNDGMQRISILGNDYGANSDYQSWAVPVGSDTVYGGKPLVLLNTHYAAPTVDDAVRGLVMAIGVQNNNKPFNGDVELLAPGMVQLYGQPVPEPSMLIMGIAIVALLRRRVKRPVHSPVTHE
jgi:hypothetical protein